MSAVVTHSTAQIPPPAFQSSVRTHVIVIFGGSAGGQTINALWRGERMSSRWEIIPGVGGKLLSWVRNDLSARLRTAALRVEGWEGTEARNTAQKRAEEDALDFIREHFDGLGKLIIYGASSGGQMALHLCWQIQARFQFFSFDRNRMVEKEPVGDQMFGLVKVDLLFTADATCDLVPDSRQRQLAPTTFTVPDLVLRHVNHYQTFPMDGLRQAPHVFEGGRSPPPDNTDWTLRVTRELDVPALPHVSRQTADKFLEDNFTDRAHSFVTGNSLPDARNAILVEFGLST